MQKHNKKHTKKTWENTKYNKSNHQTLIIIVGGYKYEFNDYCDTIYYAMSKDISDSKINNIWQLSQIRLPYPLFDCKCIITHQSTHNPKLIVLGGKNIARIGKMTMHLEFELPQIIGYHTWKRFIFNIVTVIVSDFFLCLHFCFVHFFWKQIFSF